MDEHFYQDIAAIYDRMIRWQRRLAAEAPLFERLWRHSGARRVLDAACGSGHHLKLFVGQGVKVTGADASAAMLELARQQLGELPEHRRPRLIHSSWAELPERLAERFDAVLCLGNSLPYVTEAPELRASLEGLWSRVDEGGFLLIQYKNFERLRRQGRRYLPVSGYDDPETGEEDVCVRQYDWHEGGVDFNVILLRRRRAEPSGEWVLHTWSTPLAAYRPEEVAGLLEEGGARVSVHGSLGLEPFAAEASADVVIRAER